MTFLKKLGQVMQITGKVVGVVLGFGPTIAALTPSKKDDEILAKLTDPLTQVAGIVVQMEAMSAALTTPVPGADKLTMVTPIVAQIILNSAIMAKAEIDNPALFKEGAADIAQGVVKCLNARKATGIDTVTYSG